MLRFEGDRDFALPAAELFAKLTDARFLVQCIPDVETVYSQEADKASLVLRPGFAFVRGILEVAMQIADQVAPDSARVTLDSRGIGSTANVEATLAFTERDGVTRVHWAAEIKSLGGLLKMVPQGLIRGAAEKVINDAWARVVEKVKSGEGA